MVVGRAASPLLLPFLPRTSGYAINIHAPPFHVVTFIVRIQPVKVLARRLSDNKNRVRVGLGSNNNSRDRAWHLPPPLSGPSRDRLTPLERLKHPAHGGQDLSNRYVRLERALRGKEGYEREIEDLEGQHSAANAVATKQALEQEYTGFGIGTSAMVQMEKRRGEKQPLVFHGFTIPKPPKPPEPDECCMSGCAVCVHDLYAEALDAHEHTLDRIRCALHDKGIEEATWPKELFKYHLADDGDEAGRDVKEKEDLTGKQVIKAKQASLSAFERLELQLSAKQARAQIDSTSMQSNTLASTEDRSGEEGKAAIKANSRMGGKIRIPANRTLRQMTLDTRDFWKALSWILFSRR